MLGAVAVSLSARGAARDGGTGAVAFLPYVDATLTPLYAFEDPVQNPLGDIALGFVVSATGSACEPSWGGRFSLDAASTVLELDRRIARVRERGGEVVVSFGGEANRGLARDCTDDAKLLDAYRSVVDRYQLSTIDLDLEGEMLDDGAALARDARAIAQLQASARSADRPLAVWLTVPVDVDGLSDGVVAAIDGALAAGVDLAGVNVMAMSFGASRAATDLVEVILDATHAAQAQVRDAYRRAGQELSTAAAWERLGVTVMVGRNDEAGTPLGLEAVGRLSDALRELAVGRVSMWSLNRDRPCDASVDVRRVSSNCSGVDQAPLAFTVRLADAASPFDGGEQPVAVLGAREPAMVDDPAKSPYPIWRAERSYVAGTKIVWRGYVYEARWWTERQAPDDVAGNERDWPWRLIGPVLPNDRLPSTTTLPPGTYPEWSTTGEYEKGARVLYAGLPFEAQWWTSGERPDAYSAAPEAEPWKLLDGVR